MRKYGGYLTGLLASLALAGNGDDISMSLNYVDAQGQLQNIREIDYEKMCKEGTGEFYLTVSFPVGSPLERREYRVAGSVRRGTERTSVPLYPSSLPSGGTEPPEYEEAQTQPQPILTEDATAIEWWIKGGMQTERIAITLRIYDPDNLCGHLGGGPPADFFDVEVREEPETGENKPKSVESFPVEYDKPPATEQQK